MNDDPRSNDTHTSALLRWLFKAPKLDGFMEEHAPALRLQPFHAYLNGLCREKGLLRADVIKRSGIDRSYGFQIFQGTKNPSRDKVIQLALGFDMGYEEAQELLRHARQSPLYHRIKRDAAIIYCLNRHLSFTDTQEALAAVGTATFGKEPPV